MTHILCFDLPDIFRGHFVGCPCGIFTEHGKTLYATDIQYNSMSSQLVPTTVVSSMWCDHPFVPWAQTSWVTKFPSEIPITIVTQEYETELVLKQGYFIYAQTNPEAHDKYAEGSPYVRHTSWSIKCTEESGQKKPYIFIPTARKRCLAALGAWTRKEKQHVRNAVWPVNSGIAYTLWATTSWDAEDQFGSVLLWLQAVCMSHLDSSW